MSDYEMDEVLDKLHYELDQLQHKLDQAEKLLVQAGTPESDVLKSIEMVIAQRDGLQERVDDFKSVADNCHYLKVEPAGIGSLDTRLFPPGMENPPIERHCPAMVGKFQVDPSLGQDKQYSFLQVAIEKLGHVRRYAGILSLEAINRDLLQGNSVSHEEIDILVWDVVALANRDCGDVAETFCCLSRYATLKALEKMIEHLKGGGDYDQFFEVGQ